MDKLDVYYHNKIVGTLAYKDECYYFQYAESWLSNGFSISPFSLPLEKKLFVPKNNNFKGLFGVFADSLPDAWGQLLLKRFLIKNKLNDSNLLFNLSLIGNDGRGALEYRPSKDDLFLENKNIDFDYYQKEASKILASKECDNIDYLYRFGGSSGGARPKALVKINEIPSIVKFQSHFDIKDAGIMEYDYAKAAVLCGINMPQYSLINNKYFAVTRFDRNNERKIHMISAAALLEADFASPCLDYNDLFKLTKIITRNSKEDLIELFRRMCFNVDTKNLDDHAKNFSYLYDEDLKRYKLAPAYDLTLSNTYYGEHTTSINGKGKDVLDDDLFTVGFKAGLLANTMTEIREKVRSIVNTSLKKYITK